MPAESQFTVKIKSDADVAGINATIASLQGQIEATKMLGKDTAALEAELQKVQSSRIQSELAGITGQMKGAGEGAKEASEGTGEFLEGRHGLHAIGHALNNVMPGLMQFTRFLTSGFTAAIGVALLAFEYLKTKVEEFSKAIDDMATGPGASGEWASRIADNTRAAAVETASFNERLREEANAMENLGRDTDELIAAQKRQEESAKTLADAQKQLALARLALQEKLGQISSDQAVQIRLEIDDQAFKRELAAKKAAIQAELSARQQELDANNNREPQLNSAVDRTAAAALAAKNAQDKNESQLAQEREKLNAAKESAKKSEEILLTPHHFGDRADTALKEQAEKNEQQQQNQIGLSTRAIKQMEGKETPLAEAASVAKQQADKAKSDYDEAAKLSEDVLRTVQKLKADLAAATAQNTALQNIHDQTSATQATTADVDIQNRVRAGHGTPQENQQVQDWDIQRRTSAEPGRQAAYDASNLIGHARTLMADTRGRARTGQEQAEIHEFLQEVVGHLSNHAQELNSMRGSLSDLKRQLQTLDSSHSMGGGNGRF